MDGWWTDGRIRWGRQDYNDDDIPENRHIGAVVSTPDPESFHNQSAFAHDHFPLFMRLGDPNVTLIHPAIFRVNATCAVRTRLVRLNVRAALGFH